MRRQRIGDRIESVSEPNLIDGQFEDANQTINFDAQLGPDLCNRSRRQLWCEYSHTESLEKTIGETLRNHLLKTIPGIYHHPQAQLLHPESPFLGALESTSNASSTECWLRVAQHVATHGYCRVSLVCRR